MASNAKPRQPRLRASCDGCFIAKVKCSKARPICSRCLACGLECRYSPSSRAGKPKSDNSPASHQTGAPPHLQMANLATIPDDRHMLFQGHPTPMGLYRLDTGWNTPQSLDGPMGQSAPMAPDLSALGLPANPGRRVHDGGVDMYGVGMSSWGSEVDMSTTAFADFSMASSPLPLSHGGRAASMDTAGSLPLMSPWADAISSANTPTHDLMAYDTPTSLSTPASMGSTYFPSPSVTPNLPHRHRPASVGAVAGTGSCACFSICLQSLQALHNASAPTAPPFDVVLSLNRKAVDGCAAMLACPRCMHRSGTHTAAMLLATVMGKVTSFYKSTSQLYFEDPSSGGGPGAAAGLTPASYREGPGGGVANPGLGVSLGAYKLGLEEGRWLELEILIRELRKLEEVYTQFREVCSELSDDVEVSRAMIGYLNHTLGTTLEAVKHRHGQGQGGMQCA